jgi:hypothetical protein
VSPHLGNGSGSGGNRSRQGRIRLPSGPEAHHRPAVPWGLYRPERAPGGLHRPELRLPGPGGLPWWPPPARASPARPWWPALVVSTGPGRPSWLPGCPGGASTGSRVPALAALADSTRPELRLRNSARSTQDQPLGLSRLLPFRLSGVARSVRGRLRLRGVAGRAASGGPATSSAGSRAQVPSSQRFNA